MVAPFIGSWVLSLFSDKPGTDHTYQPGTTHFLWKDTDAKEEIKPHSSSFNFPYSKFDGLEKNNFSYCDNSGV